MNQGADAYLTGKAPELNRFAEPHAYSNWWANNGSILGFMGLTISESEQEIINDATTAEEAWTKLKDRHSQEGPVKQVQLIQDALAIRYSASEKLATTSSKLTNLNKRIWAMGAPSPELFLCILMINSMSSYPELRYTRESVAQSLATSDGPDVDPVTEPSKKRFDSTDIKRALDTAQGLIDSDHLQPIDVVLAATPNNSCPRPPIQCDNKTCPKPLGHTSTYCIAPGGGMAGKTIGESKAARARDRATASGRKPGNTGSSGVHHIV
ncbi:hypothetical protein K435DRAFT_809041 [Dendrothele bispora CBS 962.96]|uniref:Uncharacterized protein n=1 Tax=Dendrothele bispora (strain CBS 962.96) TaxID=1314807 RepID=A0A4S8KZI3_DENBC|nr:hypothetical protein K435DRAFT_809041 [Dendrothele bispora CBS 962.96]